MPNYSTKTGPLSQHKTAYCLTAQIMVRRKYKISCPFSSTIRSSILILFLYSETSGSITQSQKQQVRCSLQAMAEEGSSQEPDSIASLLSTQTAIVPTNHVN